ncbi:MAG: 1-phosphofructokinase [Clostridia bacterium]|nr:1-phosphofructokinase [Clostridia bacterium]
MIYTVTFNPALDYVIHLDKLELGETNRCHDEELYFGGKGVNVSLVLRELGKENTALGFVAGFTGAALEENLRAQGIRAEFIHLKDGLTRINVKMKADQETEINAQGPAIDEEALNALFAKLDTLTEGDTLVLAGSIPSTLPADIYEKILARLQDKGIRFVVDATGKLLMNVLKYRPFLIKPNHRELEELVGRPLNGSAEIAAGAEELQKMGAKNVLISRGKDGALLLDETGKVSEMPAIGGKPVNTVGAGDSMVAGFIAGCEQGYEYALKLGSAAGGATACQAGLAKAKDIEDLLGQI